MAAKQPRKREQVKLTLQGIEERRVEIHTYESFARAIAEQVLHRSRSEPRAGERLL
jgi:hypothetical protein